VLAFRAAAAVEMQAEAAFLFDNVADLQGRGEAGYAEELALAISLSECASCVACEAIGASGLGAMGLEALIEFHSSCVAACAGQLLDAVFEKRQDVTTDEALEMTVQKSGSLGRFAGGFGARLAAADAEVVSCMEGLGLAAFTFAQLVDDLRDARSTYTGDDDLARQKKTVPLAFFHNHRALPPQPADGGTMTLSPDVGCEYESCQASLFAALVAEAFLNRAKKALQKLSQKRYMVNDLERFVESLEHSFASVLGSIGPGSATPPRDAGCRVRGTCDLRVSGHSVADVDPAARIPRPDARAS